MNTAGKLVAFVVVLALAFGGALAVGAAVGPIDVGSGSGHASAPSASADSPRGLAVAQDGHRLVLDTTVVAGPAPSELTFTIVDDDGAAVTDFDTLHERPLHLIVLSRNLVDHLHLHPAMDDGGRWHVDVPVLDPGSYRVFADFQPAGHDNLTLAADLTVSGDVDSTPLPEPSVTNDVDGYKVTLGGTPRVGDSELTFDVELDGQPVRTEPYLGAAGHLVAIRTGDLAYLHVHPNDGDTTTIGFTAAFPSAGTYRLFLDFAHRGVVRTASFTVVVPDGAPVDADSTPHGGH